MKRRLLIAAVFMASVLTPLFGRAQTPLVTEYQVKAAFLYHFAQFVDWPASSFSDEKSPFQICVLGKDPFGPALERIVVGKRVKEREIRLRRLSRPEEIGRCHILFVSSSERGRLQEILGAELNSGILTVGEMEGFTDAGGVINFFVFENKVRFEINAGVARRSGLNMSSKLLKLGTK